MPSHVSYLFLDVRPNVTMRWNVLFASQESPYGTAVAVEPNWVSESRFFLDLAV